MSPLEIETTATTDARPVELNYPEAAGNLVTRYISDNRAPDSTFYRRMSNLGINRSDATMLYRVLRYNSSLCTYEEAVAYAELEYVKYYRYISSTSYKNRHFEIRGTFTIPVVMDPADDRLVANIESLFDDVMRDLGIVVDQGWETGWKTGGEPTGTTATKFSGTSNIAVFDVLRGYRWTRNVNFTESGLTE